MEIGLLGATGLAGRVLADIGHDAVIGSRSKYRAMEVYDTILEKWHERSLSIRSADNAGAADAEVVVIATPRDAAAATGRSVADHLHRKVVTCTSNAIAQVAGEFQPLVPPRGSVSASVQAEVTDAYVAAALRHVPATELGNLDHEVASDVPVRSDHPRATETVSEIISGMPGARPLGAGGLSNATAIEAFIAVLPQLNNRYHTRVAVRLTGIED